VEGEEGEEKEKEEEEWEEEEVEEEETDEEEEMQRRRSACSHHRPCLDKLDEVLLLQAEGQLRPRLQYPRVQLVDLDDGTFNVAPVQRLANGIAAVQRRHGPCSSLRHP